MGLARLIKIVIHVGLPLLKPTVNSLFCKMNKLDDTKDTKNFIRYLVGKENINPHLYVHCYIIG